MLTSARREKQARTFLSNRIVGRLTQRAIYFRRARCETIAPNSRFLDLEGVSKMDSIREVTEAIHAAHQDGLAKRKRTTRAPKKKTPASGSRLAPKKASRAKGKAR